MNPKVSVLLITYNQERFIEEAIVSAAEQDYDNLEVVAADDCSTDSTGKIIKGLEKKYPGRVKAVVGETNLGITGNCNRGLVHCDGKYTAHIGGDDVFCPGKIAKQVEWMEGDQRRVLSGHDVEVFYTAIPGFTHVRKHGRAGRSGVGNIRLLEYGVDSFFMGTSMMWRTDRVPEFGFDNRLPIVADWKFILDIVGEDGIWGSIDGAYARYRRHDANITTRLTRYELYRDCLETIRIVSGENRFSEDSLTKAKLAIFWNYAENLWAAKKYDHAKRIYKSMWEHGSHFHFYMYRRMLRHRYNNFAIKFEMALRNSAPYVYYLPARAYRFGARVYRYGEKRLCKALKKHNLSFCQTGHDKKS